MSQDSQEGDNLLDDQQQSDDTPRHHEHHSYLPGTGNPLFPASLLEQQRRHEQEGCKRKSTGASDELQELAILELDSVVLFPGSTLPLRLRHSPWIDYLGPKIDESRGHPTEQVRVGIVPHVRTMDRRRSSGLRMSFTTGTGQAQQAQGLLALINMNGNILEDDEDDDEDYDENEEEESEVEDDEPSAEYHELMDEGEDSDVDVEAVGSHDSDAPSHQASETAGEPEESEHVGEEVQQEENVEAKDQQDEDMQQQQEQRDHGNEETGSDAQPAAQPSQVRYDMPLVEENLNQIDRSLNDAEEVLEGIYDNEIDHRHLLNISRRLDRAEAAQQPIVEAFDTVLDLIRNGARLSDPAFSDLLRIARRHRVRVAAQLDRMQSIHFRLRHLNEQAGTHSGDPLIGRIGTVATVSYTFDENSDILNVGNDDAPRDEERDEVVVTVLGTNRFQIISRVGDDDDNGAMNRHRMVFGRGHDMSEVRLYMVRELPDKEVPQPPLFIRSQRPMQLMEEADQRYSHHHNQVVQKLSNASSIPHVALKSVWPWRLVGLIRSALDRVSVFDGLTKNLPSLQENSSLLEPTSFSFWMACNMSLSQEDKLYLLKMPTTVERLRYILKKVLEQEENETNVCCKSCRSRLSSASEMFTVGGAEGTTGAYVNEYGVIHQTVTLRDADETKLAYSGGPETRDSWFPGYSWTITYCQRCHSHLGWKFHLVRNGAATEDRPEYFYGWSSSSVTFLSS